MALVISIGADPELFCREKATGRFVSAHDLIPGTKLKPHPVERGAVQVDGVAAEFNITPSLDSGSFITSINTVTKHLTDFLGEKYELVAEPVCDFPEDYFKTLPLDVRELGCNPDFNAWTGQVNEAPDASRFMRTAAGHIHVGWCKDADPTDTIHFDDCRVIAKQLDYYLGMFSLMWDPDTRRRSLYGRAGSFRPKPYGIEYRSLSNVWLNSSKLATWLWHATHKAMTDLIQENTRLEDKLGDTAREAIDGNIEWWKDQKHPAYLLRKMTGMEAPPPIPKPGDPKVVVQPPNIVGNRIYTGASTTSEFYHWISLHPEFVKQQVRFDPARNEYYYDRET